MSPFKLRAESSLAPLELLDATGTEMPERAMAAKPITAQKANNRRKLVSRLFWFAFRCSMI
jgi:hypothetical protein